MRRGLALGVRRFLGIEIALDALEGLVGQPGFVAFQGRQAVAGGGLNRHFAADFEIAAGRAVEIARFGVDIDGLAGAAGGGSGGQFEIEPFGDVILDKEGGFADRGTPGIGEGLEFPCAGRGARLQIQRQAAPAEALVLDRDALVFDAIGALDHECQRQAGSGHAFGIAQQCGDENGFSGAVDAALREDQRVHRFRGRAALDATIRQIEGRAAEVDEAIVAFGIARHHEAGGEAAGAARQSGIEADVALGGCGLGCQNLVAARDETQFDAG